MCVRIVQTRYGKSINNACRTYVCICGYWMGTLRLRARCSEHCFVRRATWLWRWHRAVSRKTFACDRWHVHLCGLSLTGEEPPRNHNATQRESLTRRIVSWRSAPASCRVHLNCVSFKCSPTNAPSFPCFWRMHRYDPSRPHISQDSLHTQKTCGGATRKCSRG